MTDNVALVEAVYRAIGAGDLPAVLDHMSDDIQIEVPGSADIPFAGTFAGHEGAQRFFGAIAASTQIDRFEPREFIADHAHVVVLGNERLTATATGRSWSTDWAMVWTVEDGKIRRLREFHQTDAIANAFRGE